jgi:hypothetical protein
MRKLFAVIVLFSACATTAANPTPPPVQLNETLRDELIAMRDVDQEARRRWVKDRENPQINAELNAIDERNTARLHEIVKVYGWPGKSLVGPKGAGAAWTLAQHSAASSLKQFLPLMRIAFDKGELDGGLYATSVDRVLINEGKKQLYGSQFDTDGDKCEPKPVEDPANLDARRKEIGLGPMSEYAAQLCALYKGKS